MSHVPYPGLYYVAEDDLEPDSAFTSQGDYQAQLNQAFMKVISISVCV